MPNKLDHIQELSFDVYQKRQQFETTSEALINRAKALSSTNKFKFKKGIWQKMPYKGYAIVSMVDANPHNTTIRQKLIDFQNFITDAVDNAEQHFFLLPAASFHQTIANTLSSNRFKEHIQDKGLEAEYPQIIANAFSKINHPTPGEPIEMSLIGLSIFGSALGILGVFDREEDYRRIIDFRNQIYHNPSLNQHDIKRTRPFIGHLTMIYIDGTLSELQKDQLVQSCLTLNAELSQQPLKFVIQNTQLRHYEELSQFQTQANFPAFRFA